MRFLSDEKSLEKNDQFFGIDFWSCCANRSRIAIAVSAVEFLRLSTSNDNRAQHSADRISPSVRCAAGREAAGKKTAVRDREEG